MKGYDSCLLYWCNTEKGHDRRVEFAEKIFILAEKFIQYVPVLP
jgi:hypothetical protein